jgi:uncharacterized phage protein (TIGR02220 family)
MGDVVPISDTPEPAKPLPLIDLAAEVLAFLNKKTGKKFAVRNPVGAATSNAQLIMHRLKEGYTVPDLKAMVACKCRQWVHDPHMSRYLTPVTLFGRQKFDSYMGEIGGEDS